MDLIEEMRTRDRVIRNQPQAMEEEVRMVKFLSGSPYTYTYTYQGQNWEKERAPSDD